MMEALLVLIAMGLVVAAGAGALLLLAPGRRGRFGFSEFLAYSWLAGSLVVSLGTFALGLVLSGTALRMGISLGCMALLLLGSRRLSTQVESPRFPRTRGEQALLAGIAAQILFFCWLATRQYFGWDGLAVWEIKARAAFLSGGIPHAEFFGDPTRRWCHQAYPMFLPLLESWIYSWLGECNQSWVRVLFPPFYAAGVIVLGTGVSKLGGNRLIGLLAGILPFFIPFIMRRDGGVLSGYADFPLSVYYLAGVIQLLLAKRELSGATEGAEGRTSAFAMSGLAGATSSVHLRAFGLICLALPWVKDEGKLLWLCLAIIGGILLFPALRWRSWIPAMPGLLTVVIWGAFKYWVHVPPNRDILPMTPSTLIAHIDRLGPLLREVVREMGNLGHWSLLWVGGLAAIYISLRDLRRGGPNRWVSSFAVLAPLSIYTCIYFFSATPNYLVHFWTSYPRLLLQLAPTGLLAVIFAAIERPAK